MSEPLRPGDVIAVYEHLLGRTPQADEVSHQLATAPAVGDLLDVVLESAEYAARATTPTPPLRAREQPPVVNVHHPDLAGWSHPPGRRSRDRDAIVGHDGWLFLCSGSNSVVEQFTGKEPEPGWADGWHEALRLRAAAVADLGARMAFVVVPDKLAVYQTFYPEPLVPTGPRPIERLLGHPNVQITYPIEELQRRSAEVPVFLRTDSHLSYHGNATLYEAIRAQIGAPAVGAGIDPAASRYLTAGDLGARYDPQIVEIVEVGRNIDSPDAARIIADNRKETIAVGAHLGTRRVFANDTAPDGRTVVLFGDSFGFSDEAYRGLSWFLAQAFREVHFVWVPFGWDPEYARRVRADVVVFEGAERFLARVPLAAVDTAELARETLGRKQAGDPPKASDA